MKESVKRKTSLGVHIRNGHGVPCHVSGQGVVSDSGGLLGVGDRRSIWEDEALVLEELLDDGPDLGRCNTGFVELVVCGDFREGAAAEGCPQIAAAGANLRRVNESSNGRDTTYQRGKAAAKSSILLGSLLNGRGHLVFLGAETEESRDEGGA